MASSAATSSASTQNASSRRASTASGSERRNSRSTGLAQARSVSRAEGAPGRMRAGVRAGWCRQEAERDGRVGRGEARRRVGRGGVVVGRVDHRDDDDGEAGRCRCLAITTMGLRWPTPQRREQHKRLCPHGYRLPGPAAPINQKGCEKPKQKLINIVRAWLNGTPSVPM
ncbi:Os03g0814200 [Oryza sativa Japonica Group]|uniref:Os03g0814200 protein n=2 Tax=Oryza sativa subsp. japonica TaxID=39947 RepID=Q75HG1_ORYSJ|nr:hypothetical protein [Oryza sativa Japonica Group]ABF99524.1 hypothetical protein LOC_Os03g59940 [Oryza sativa Japonica Group]EAZ29037.1 hypothetical protein OsJ_13088 [Oryza sativa Japonica Group]KAB8094151.1 hypothetical protein EE612_021232 [Oryza sativa]BAS87023.1 Os03g0814200 [Oryza sativa Japonica Group]